MTNKLTNDKVLHIANISNLDLSAKEVEKYKHQLSNILDFVDQLSEVDTKDITETTSTTGLSGVYRKDVLEAKRPSFSQDEATSGSQLLHGGYFKVDAVLKNKN